MQDATDPTTVLSAGVAVAKASEEVSPPTHGPGSKLPAIEDTEGTAHEQLPTTPSKPNQGDPTTLEAAGQAAETPAVSQDAPVGSKADIKEDAPAAEPISQTDATASAEHVLIHPDATVQPVIPVEDSLPVAAPSESSVSLPSDVSVEPVASATAESGAEGISAAAHDIKAGSGEPLAEALSRVSSRDAALSNSTPPPASPERPVATPPMPGVAAAGKKFASSLTVNKKFLDKLGPDAKASAAAAAKVAPAAAAGRPLAALSPTTSATSPIASTAGPRLLTGRLSSAIPGVNNGQWARGTNVANGSFLAFQTNAGRGAPGPLRGRGRGGVRMGGDVWGRSAPGGEPGAGPPLGRLGDFPTAAEAAKSKQLKANAIAAANAAKENASRQAAEAADRAAAEYNQHLLENLDNFRGLHLDPNASHWDEMEDDDIGDVVDFGDGAQYKLEDQVEEPAKPDVPAAPVNEFDRGRLNGPGPERRLFNANLNKLESVAPRREPAAPPAGVLKKGKGAQRAISPATPRDRPVSPTTAKDAPSAPVERPKLPPAPTKSPWVKPAGELPPAPADLPTVSEAAVAPSTSDAAPAAQAPAIVEEPAQPKGPKVGTKEFEKQQEQEMRERALQARKRREEEEKAEAAAAKERLEKKLAELAAKSPPKPVAAPLPSISAPAEPPKPIVRRPSAQSPVDDWRARPELPSAPPPAPIPPKAVEAPLTEPAARPALAEKVQLLRKPAPPVIEPSRVEDGPAAGSKPPRGQTKERRPSQPAETERFWRRAVPELAPQPERTQAGKVFPPPPEDLGHGVPPPIGHRAVTKGKNRREPIARPDTLTSAARQDDASLDSTMARIKAAISASKDAGPSQEPIMADLLSTGGNAKVKLPGGSEGRRTPQRPPVILQPEAFTTATILELPRDSVWRTYKVMLAKLPEPARALEADALNAFWARPPRRDRLDVVSFRPPNADWSMQRLERDRGLFKEPFVPKNKPRRPPRVRFVPTAAALEHLAARALLAGDLPLAAAALTAQEAPPLARVTSRERGRADAEATWRRPAAAKAPVAAPEISNEVESSLFDVAGPSTIRLAFPTINGSAARRVEVRLTRTPTPAGDDLVPIDAGGPQVRLPSSAHRRQRSAAVDNAPIQAAAALAGAVLFPGETVPPLAAALISSDDESVDVPRPMRTGTPPIANGPSKAFGRVGGMSESVHAAPFAPSTPLQDGSAKARAAAFASPASWSPAAGSNTSFSIIDPMLKNVWGPSDSKVDVSSSSTQENSLKGIVDDLPAASMAALNELKSDDGLSASPTIETTMSHDSPFTSAATSSSRQVSGTRPDAADALAAVGGLPFGRHRVEDEQLEARPFAMPSPPQVSAASPFYTTQYAYSAAPPASMPYSLMSAGMVPVAMGGSPWMMQQAAGLTSPYAPPPARHAYAAAPEAYASWPGQPGYTPHSYAPMVPSYKTGGMRGNSRPPIGSGRPNGASFRPMAMSPGPPLSYEAISSPNMGAASLPGAAPLSHRSASGAAPRQPTYTSFPAGGRWS